LTQPAGYAKADVVVRVLDERHFVLALDGFGQEEYSFVGSAEDYVAGRVLAGHYVDTHGQPWEFSSTGKVAGPSGETGFRVGLDYTRLTCDYVYTAASSCIFCFKRTPTELTLSALQQVGPDRSCLKGGRRSSSNAVRRPETLSLKEGRASQNAHRPMENCAANRAKKRSDQNVMSARLPVIQLPWRDSDDENPVRRLSRLIVSGQGYHQTDRTFAVLVAIGTCVSRRRPNQGRGTRENRPSSVCWAMPTILGQGAVRGMDCGRAEYGVGQAAYAG